ncbi:unnamed protein product [Peronospora farinosa]|uniref:Thioredoxin domain-containing protein n=1 Tax=Peronospora farinosa TaxID=134698 RepID=A0ABN8CEA7_9STRA|nr:unnamed protein product [Peronospora farinosa]
MLLRTLFGAFCLYCVSWTGSSGLSTITNSADLAAVELSTKVHVLLVMRTKDETQEQSLEELVTTAYPALLAIEKELEGLVTFSVVDIASHKVSFGNKWQLTKLPALVLYKDPPKENPYTGKLYRDAMRIDSAMLENPKKLKRTLKQAIPMEFVQELKGDETTFLNFEKLVQQKVDDEETLVLLISKQKHASPMYRALAAEFNDQGLSFVFLNKEEKGTEEIMKMLVVEELPVMMVMKSMIEYEVLKAQNLKTYNEFKGFVKTFATHKRSGGYAGEKRNKGGKKNLLYIKFFTEKEFDDLVMQPDVVWIIEFMDLEREMAITEDEWKKALTELHRKAGVVAMGAVSCEKEAELCERHGGPGVRIFPLGLTHDKKLKRDGVLAQTFTTIDEAKETSIATIPDLTVTIASSSDLNAFISHARENHALPVLLFTTKKTTPPMIKALLLSVPTQKLMLAVIHDADEDLRERFLVKSPASTSLVCLVPTQVNLDDSASAPFGVVAYEKKRMGSYTYPNIMQFLLQVLAQYPHPQDAKPKSNDVDLSSLDEVAAQSLVPYMTKKNIYDICGGHKICAIGFFEDHLDTLRDPESRLTKWWTTFVHVAARSKENHEPFQFMWVNGKCQKNFAKAFGIGLFQMPTLAVYSPSKQRFATNVGVFDEENASAFLKSVLSGSISTAPIGDVPELDEECSFDEIHDVAEGVDGITEDDTDLDDMLNEILFDEKQQRDELEKELKSELKQPLKRKKKKDKTKKKKKHKTKTKMSKKKTGRRDEL